jgi:putative endonuclease
MGSDRRQELGRLGERLAAEHLARRGFRIVERNYRTRFGELDIVAFDGATLAFCEVKTRRAPASEYSPFDAIHPRKRAQVRRMALSWLADRSVDGFAPVLRFDAIGVVVGATGELVALEHLEDAF